jgi:hypothetical protein
MADTPEDRKDTTRDDDAAQFLAEADSRQPGLLSEFFAFLGHNRKWWLTPIVVVLLLLGGLLLLAATGAAPFVYTLF